MKDETKRSDGCADSADEKEKSVGSGKTVGGECPAGGGIGGDVFTEGKRTDAACAADCLAGKNDRCGCFASDAGACARSNRTEEESADGAADSKERSFAEASDTVGGSDSGNPDTGNPPEKNDRAGRSPEDDGADGGELLSERARVIAATEGETAFEETEVPRRRVRDFLYRHRALFIICTVTVLLVLLSLKIFFSGGALADVSMIYAGPVPLYSDTGGAIVSAIRSVHSGEDAEEIYLTDVLWYSPEDEAALGDAYSVDAAENARALMEFREEMTSGECVLMLLSPQLYREVGEGLLPLSEVFGAEAAQISADGYSVRLGDTDFYSYFTAAKVLPEDTLICMRDVSKMKIYGEGKGAEADEKCRSVFRDIVNFVDPTPTDSTASDDTAD